MGLPHRRLWLLAAVCFTLCRAGAGTAGESVLKGRVICLDPGHGGTAATDQYRVGPSGEREEWINLRVARFLRDMLEARGARVVMTREDDVAVGLRERADKAREVRADVFLSIHHNSTADRSVNFPIIYYHGYASRNEAGVRLAGLLARRLNQELFGGRAEPSVCSDHTIFATSGAAVLRHTHAFGIPGALGEASFFSSPEEEVRLRDPEYNRREALAYVRALEEFFSAPIPPPEPMHEAEPLPPFRAFQEAERMNEAAKRWLEDYREGQRLMEGPSRDPGRAFELLTRSVKSFPDSNVARECHLLRARLLEDEGRSDEARRERRRVREFYAVP